MRYRHCFKDLLKELEQLGLFSPPEPEWFPTLEERVRVVKAVVGRWTWGQQCAFADLEGQEYLDAAGEWFLELLKAEGAHTLPEWFGRVMVVYIWYDLTPDERMAMFAERLGMVREDDHFSTY